MEVHESNGVQIDDVIGLRPDFVHQVNPEVVDVVLAQLLHQEFVQRKQICLLFLQRNLLQVAGPVYFEEVRVVVLEVDWVRKALHYLPEKRVDLFAVQTRIKQLLHDHRVHFPEHLLVFFEDLSKSFLIFDHEEVVRISVYFGDRALGLDNHREAEGDVSSVGQKRLRVLGNDHRWGKQPHFLVYFLEFTEEAQVFAEAVEELRE